jgi:DNA-binding beta-propeller fold protein YncE
MSSQGAPEAAEKNGRLYRILSVWGLFVTLCILSACTGPATLHTTRPATELQWPPQTDGPRIVWIKSIAGGQDAGVVKGFWRRTLEFFTGEDDRAIVRPHGVLYDVRERLFITDPGGGVVHFMDIGNGGYRVIGEELDSPLKTPIGVAEDDDDHLYITDSTTGMIYRYDLTDGTLKPWLRQKLQRPTGIVYNRVNKLLYVVDTVAPAVIGFDETGTERLRFGSAGAGPAQFNRPTDIAADSQGQLYVTDALNYRVHIFSPEGAPVTRIGAAGDAPGELTKPKGVAVDSGGHIYVSDALQDAVQIFDDSGRLLMTFGSSGSRDGEFWMPSGVYIDRQDYIFVVDTYNRRVQLFRYLPGTPVATNSVPPDTGNLPRGKGP